MTTLADPPLVLIASTASPGLAERLDLPREHPIERVVVGDAGQHAGVGRQRDGGQRGALALKAAHQLGGHVLRVGGAAAIAEDEQLAATVQRRDNRRRGRDDRLNLAPPNALVQRDRLAEHRIEALSVAQDDPLRCSRGTPLR